MVNPGIWCFENMYIDYSKKMRHYVVEVFANRSCQNTSNVVTYGKRCLAVSTR